MSRRFTSAKGPSQRQLRAGELIRHTLVEIFAREDLRDPVLAGLSITVSEVRMSPDLKQATAFCTPLGASVDAEPHDDVIKALNRAGPHIRHLLAARIELKFTPALIFRDDASFDEARRIDALLAGEKVRRDLEKD